MSKKAIITVVIAVVVLAAVGGAVWYATRPSLRQGGQENNPVVTENNGQGSQDSNNIENNQLQGEVVGSPAADVDTSNWQTYRNEEYGFEVRYPEGWGIKEENNKLSFIDPDNYEDFYKWTEMQIGFWDNVDNLEEKLLEYPKKEYGYKTMQEFVDGEMDVFSYSVKNINNLDITVLTMGAHIANDYYYLPSHLKNRSYIKINMRSGHKLKNSILSTIKIY